MVEPQSAKIREEPCPYEFSNGCWYDYCWFSHQRPGHHLNRIDCRNELNKGECKRPCVFKHKKGNPGPSITPQKHVLALSTSEITRKGLFLLLSRWSRSTRFSGLASLAIPIPVVQQKYQEIHLTNKDKVHFSFSTIRHPHTQLLNDSDKKVTTTKVFAVAVVLTDADTDQALQGIVEYLTQNLNLDLNGQNFYILKPATKQLQNTHNATVYDYDKPLISKSDIPFINQTNNVVDEIQHLRNQHDDVITSFAVADNGVMISGSIDKKLRAYSGLGQQQIARISDREDVHTNWIWSVAISPDGSRIVSGSLDGSVNLYHSKGNNIFSNQEVIPSRTNKDIMCVALSIDNKYIAASSKDSSIYLYKTHNLEAPPMILESQQGTIMTMKFFEGHPTSRFNKGQYLAIGGDRGEIEIFEIERESGGLSDKPIATKLIASDNIRSIDVSPDGGYLVAGSDDLSIYVQHLIKFNEHPHRLPNVHRGAVPSVSICRGGNDGINGKYIVSGSEDGSINIYFYDFDRTQNLSVPIQIYQLRNAHGGTVHNQVLSVVWTQNRIISACEDSTIKVFKPNLSALQEAVKIYSTKNTSKVEKESKVENEEEKYEQPVQSAPEKEEHLVSLQKKEILKEDVIAPEEIKQNSSSNQKGEAIAADDKHKSQS